MARSGGQLAPLAVNKLLLLLSAKIKKLFSESFCIQAIYVPYSITSIEHGLFKLSIGMSGNSLIDLFSLSNRKLQLLTGSLNIDFM
jgi:hypothetical protein